MPNAARLALVEAYGGQRIALPKCSGGRLVKIPGADIVLVLVRSADDPQPLIAEGECPGEILTAPRGEGGFGYDPLFWLPEFGQAMAELSAEQKNKISHRGQAIARLVERLAPRA